MHHPFTLAVHSVPFSSVDYLRSCYPSYLNVIGIDRDMDRQRQKRRRSQDLDNAQQLELEEWAILEKAKRLRIGINHSIVPSAATTPPIEYVQSSVSTLPAAPPNPQHFPLRPMIISTRSQAANELSPAEALQSDTVEPSSQQYNHINSYLHSLHVMRHGNPEEHERWWEKDNETEQVAMDMDDEPDTSQYANINSVLRQAFLTRHLNPHER